MVPCKCSFNSKRIEIAELKLSSTKHAMNLSEAPQVKPEQRDPSLPQCSQAGLATAMLLSELRVGQAAEIRNVNGTDSITARLLEMGLIPGTTISLVGKAPLGDPLEFELRGYRLSLRKTEAQRVAIEAQN
jgi:ferrous iron transport protein A